MHKDEMIFFLYPKVKNLNQMLRLIGDKINSYSTNVLKGGDKKCLNQMKM